MQARKDEAMPDVVWVGWMKWTWRNGRRMAAEVDAILRNTQPPILAFVHGHGRTEENNTHCAQL